ncbi:MAG: hypothetical protein ACOYMN_08110 [Roseimicrobium sp.]
MTPDLQRADVQVDDACFVAYRGRAYRAIVAHIFREGCIQVRTRAAAMVCASWRHLGFRAWDGRGWFARDTRLIPTPAECRRCKRRLSARLTRTKPTR